LELALVEAQDLLALGEHVENGVFAAVAATVVIAAGP